MFCVGLTGGIGVGKSLVAQFFKDEGADIVDTDVIARDLLAPGMPMHDLVIQHLGSQVCQANGELDRSALKRIIFSDPTEKKWLENLMHPVIRARAKDLAQTSTSCYVIIVIPLLIEAGLDNYLFLDRICLVTAPPELQLTRTIARDHLSEHEALRIIQSQASEKDRLKVAQDVIENHGSLEDLRTQVRKLHVRYLQHG